MAGVAQQIFWQSFSPAPAVGESGSYGFFIRLAQLLSSGGSVVNLWLRSPNNPSLLGLIATVGAFLVIIYMEGVRVELPLSYAGYRGYRSRYPIKLLYVSNLPVIFASALFANVYFFSQIFWNMGGRPAPGTNFWFDLLGQFNAVRDPTTGAITRYDPVGGLVYYVTAPHSFINVMDAPVKALVYLGILVAFCVVFSLTWLEVGGLGPSTVAKQLVDSGMEIPGYRRSGKAVELLLKRYIPAVTVVGGVVVGMVAGISDFFGVFGSGMGILLSVGIIYQYYELLMQERAAEMYPALRRILGE
jgi:preprotein translocase subunit SecY